MLPWGGGSGFATDQTGKNKTKEMDQQTLAPISLKPGLVVGKAMDLDPEGLTYAKLLDNNKRVNDQWHIIRCKSLCF